MVHKMLWLLASDSSLHFCRGRQSCWELLVYFSLLLLFFLIQLIIEALSVFGGAILHDFAFCLRIVTTQKGSFTSLNSNEEKKSVPICSQWFGLLFILVLALDQCPSLLCLTKAATFAWQASEMRPPTWLAAGNVHYRSGTVSGINWEQGNKNDSVAEFCFT